MRVNLIAYIATAIVFFGLDFIWLSQATAILYRPRLGGLLLDKPIMSVAAGFYLIYVVGIVFFAVMPALAAESWLRAAGTGALLGLVAYGTYDMTNLATVAGWSVAVSVADMLWGVIVTATASVAGYFITRLIV